MGREFDRPIQLIGPGLPSTLDSVDADTICRACFLGSCDRDDSSFHTTEHRSRLSRTLTCWDQHAHLRFSHCTCCLRRLVAENENVFSLRIPDGMRVIRRGLVDVCLRLIGGAQQQLGQSAVIDCK